MPLEESYTNNVQIDDIDNSRIIEDVHISSEVTSDVVDELVKSNIPKLNKTRVHEENVSDIQDALVEPSTLIPDDTDVSEDDTSAFEHILMGSNMPVHVARYSLAYL